MDNSSKREEEEIEEIVEETEIVTEEDVESKKADYAIGGIVLTFIGIFIIAEGVQEHASVVSTIWFIVLSGITLFIYEKFELDEFWFFRRLIFSLIFFSLLFLSYIVHLALKFIGLDLLIWTF